MILKVDWAIFFLLLYVKLTENSLDNKCKASAKSILSHLLSNFFTSESWAPIDKECK